MATGFHRPYRGGSSRGNFRGRGRARSSGNVILGFNALQKLRGKDPDDIVLDLASERCIPAFKALLNKTEYSKDMVELVMEVLASSCDSNSPEYFNKLLTEIPRSLFIVLHLKSYITRLYMQRNFTTNLQLFVERTVRLFSEILKRIPSAFETLPLGDLELAAVTLKDRGLIDDVVIREVEQLKVIKEESLEKQRRKEELETLRKTRAHNQETGAVGPPPEDFREMTIIPQYEDIYTDKKPYLRKNIVEGGYDDLDHYLDVQFRLLREDFLRPLREGIVDLVSRGIEEKQGMFKDIRVYRNVKILYPECSNSGLLHHIQFDNSRLRWVRWENSKRLIFGSLLCLSKDNFQTFVFATVANRDPKELVHGKVTVRFMDSTFDTQDFSRRNIYQMVETTAYFEAYSPILKGLQQTEPKDLPFQRYLVECNKDIQPPKYLVRNRFALSTPSFNFSSILVKDTDVHVSELDYIRRLQRLRLGSSNVAQFQAVPVLDVTQWPSKDQLGLDESQYKALQIALTKEVAVIQGPPGTGKTYLGLKIAKILLDNKEKWIEGTPTLIANRREVNQTPILVICYTNHALDQFLEGIYDFHGENENKIVRIGGRSKSEKLKECNLSAIKYRSKKAPIYIRRGIYEVYQNLEGVTHAMERSSNILKKCWQNILFERTLHRTGVVKEQQYQALMRPFDTEGFGGPEPGSVVLRWLNLVAGETVQDEYVAIDDHIKRFNGQDMIMCEGLLLAGNDFSISTEVKTRQGGAIISSVAVDGRWTNNSKLVYIDPNGIVKFIAAQNTLCETYSSVNDDKWHEIAVVYSEEENRLTLYVDKRMEGTQTVAIPNDNPYNVQVIGYTPNFHLVTPGHFVGHMRNFVYCPSTKYSEQVTGDVSVEYEIEFMQEQRKVDGECDIPDKFTPRSVPRVDDFDVVDPSDLVTSTGGWEVQNKKRAKNKIKFEVIKQLQSDDVMTDEEVSTIQNVWRLEVRDRWRLYRKWVRDISQQHQNTIALVRDEYDKGMKELQELRNAESYELLREAHVIGMTTTGAAKYRDLLHRIKPKITIVEEAAEVLESHIVTALTGGCEHLILIGDHKQLRPKPTVFQLGLDYQLDISLFERMVENGMPFARLRKQHRMRPEISVMMRPIYDDLLDHDSVRNKKNIKGINKNIFFIDHVVKEDAVDENKSHSNIHEAKFIGSLCKYLLQQGYLPSQITVLTPYTGQLFQLKKFVPNVKDLRICVVDNFQGEENDIILLSLVRSRDFVKSEKKDMRRMIGFLAIDNRICVSLSRAKEGFFCIGNLSLMRSANDLWSEILDDMEARGSVGKALPLACQNHPTTITHVSNEADFNKAPNGGCSVPCQARLACGHSCEQICHPTDPQHLEYSCRKKCPKKCIRDHPCRRLCYQDCGKCMVTIAKVVPKCGHIMSMPCHQDPETFQCTKPCTKNLPCGHACPNKCGEACTKRCLEQVTKKWFPCGHSNKTPCYIDPATEKCPNPCGTVLKCEHICTGTCGGCKQGRLHEPCSSRCDRLRFCGHQCKVPCTKNCPPCPEICPNRCPHSKCRNKCGEPCKECKEPCKWRCIHYTCTKLCGELCDRPRCNRPCAKFKRCGHACPGLCGESCPRKCLVCDKEELTEIFFGGEDEEDARFLELADCRHVFEVKGMDQYMDMKVKDLKKGQSTSIQMIKCPRCHTAIRTSLRYGNIIKSILQDFENVKRTIETGNMISQPDEFRRKVRDEIEASDLESEFPDEVYEITKAAGTAGGLTRDKQNIVENQIQFLKFMTKLKAILKQVERVDNRHYFHRMLSSNAREDEIALLKHELQMLSKWVMEQRHRFSEQELEDFNDELLRSWIMFSYKALNIEVERRKIELSDLQTSRMEYAEKKLASGKKLKESQKEKCIKYLDYIARKHPSLNVKYTSVTEEEKKMIVKAMGFEQGHWFKCPQGHVYCIGECGGATQEADCPECGSKIGGSRHQIRPDNLLAPEMDGARFPAWSDTANNMRNWIFD